LKRASLFIYSISLLLIFVLECLYFNNSIDASTESNLRGQIIAIDPGHGGVDHGALGISNIKEDNLNLQVSLILKQKLKQAGAVVILTRENEAVNYSGDASTRKRRDMENRAKLIQESKPNIVISIHMNKNRNRKFFGPQTYFLKTSDSSKALASCIQDELLASLPSYKKYRIVEGDYFILHVVDVPTVLVECGFLSNSSDSKRLQDTEYQQKIAESILRGINKYYGVQYN
jgi:N-acetylmuramoyl-L-alanine amidase